MTETKTRKGGDRVMKITEIRVRIEPDALDREFYGVRIQVLSDTGRTWGVDKAYPVDHMVSLFERVWRGIGEELKRAITQEE